MGPREFKLFRTLVHERTGIWLRDGKQIMLASRLSRRLRHHGLQNFADYYSYIQNHRDNGEEIGELINCVTTNKTSFFRERHHFDFLANTVVPQIQSASRPGSLGSIRIWSGACSTGEEPYSIAMTLLEALPELLEWNVRILATDLDSDVLATAANGQYAAERVKGLSDGRLRRFFTEQKDRGRSLFVVRPEVRRLVMFKQLNLMQPLPMTGPLDVIFCRNTVIYFDKDTQRNLFTRIAPLQRPGDLLYLGHSESLLSVSTDYESIGRTTYLRR